MRMKGKVHNPPRGLITDGSAGEISQNEPADFCGGKIHFGKDFTIEPYHQPSCLILEDKMVPLGRLHIQGQAIRILREF